MAAGPAALAAGAAVSLLALVFGFGILRLRGAFFALATIGVNEAVRQFVTNFEPWGGATGIYLSFDAYEPLGGPMPALWIVYFLLCGVMTLSLLLSYAIKTSKFGLGLLAIGQNEDAAGGARRAYAAPQGAGLQRLGVLAGHRRRAFLLQERHHRAQRRVRSRPFRSRRS